MNKYLLMVMLFSGCTALGDDYPLVSKSLVNCDIALQDYPFEARRNKQQGKELVTAKVKDSGEIIKARIIKSSGYPALDQAALETLMRSKCRPTILEGKSKKISFNQHFVFILE